MLLFSFWFQCKEMVTIRQRLIAEDVKVEKTFYSACRKDIKEHGCNKKDKVAEGDFRRANILLCLENAIKTGKIQKAQNSHILSFNGNRVAMVYIQRFSLTFGGLNFHWLSKILFWGWMPCPLWHFLYKWLILSLDLQYTSIYNVILNLLMDPT